MRSKSQNIMQNIISYIDNYYFENLKVPTMSEISQNVGIDKSNVSRYIKDMVEQGLLESDGRFRGIKTQKMQKIINDTTSIPIVGDVACGSPILAEQNIECYVNMSQSFIGQGEFFALHAKGDSMINAGINDGDIVIVKRQDSADEGQIIVALVGDEATIKRYYLDNNQHKVILRPENDRLQDMIFDSVNIQGIVKKVIKDIR